MKAKSKIHNMSLQKRARNIHDVILDFDGTLTDGFVYTDQAGRESVRCSRRDGLGIEMLKKAGLRLLVLSKEKNSVVAARCRKLGIACVSGVDDKGAYLQKHYSGILKQVLYMGDDINDLECIRIAGIGVAVADGDPECRRVADIVTKRRGGDHAVREMCDLILESKKNR